jgi:hypothetical protein
MSGNNKRKNDVLLLNDSKENTNKRQRVVALDDDNDNDDIALADGLDLPTRSFEPSECTDVEVVLTGNRKFRLHRLCL